MPSEGDNRPGPAMTTPQQVLVDVADLEALRAYRHPSDAIKRLIAAIPEPEPPAEPCRLYTARRWSPLSPVPEDDRCVNCGEGPDAHEEDCEPLPPSTRTRQSMDCGLACNPDDGHLSTEPGCVLYEQSHPEPLPPSFVPLLDGDETER